jgi:hypothetical protein
MDQLLSLSLVLYLFQEGNALSQSIRRSVQIQMRDITKFLSQDLQGEILTGEFRGLYQEPRTTDVKIVWPTETPTVLPIVLIKE